MIKKAHAVLKIICSDLIHGLPNFKEGKIITLPSRD